MTDFTLNAPGTTNSPWTPANVIILDSTIKSDATGFRATTPGTFVDLAHNVNYGSTVTATATIAAGATSNGDQIYLGGVVRSGANAAAGVGVLIDAFICAAGWWDITGNTFTKVSTPDNSITRANSDVWTVTLSISGGVISISCLQNATPITFGGSNTTTQWAGEASLAAGLGLTAGNNNSLYLSQFTGTGVSGGGGSPPLMGQIIL